MKPDEFNIISRSIIWDLPFWAQRPGGDLMGEILDYNFRRSEDCLCGFVDRWFE